MRNLIVAVLVLGVAFVGLQTPASANLITDPSFENGGSAIVIRDNATDWTWSGGANGDSFYNPGVAKTGTKSAKVSMWGGNNTDYAYFVKDLTGIDFTQPYQFSANFLRNSADDLKSGSVGTLQLKWQNSLGALLRQDNSVVFDNSYSADTWNLISLTTATPPAGSAKLSAVVALTTTSTYAPNSSFFVDDMSLNAIPEPASLTLLGSGLLGLLGLSRKKRE